MFRGNVMNLYFSKELKNVIVNGSFYRILMFSDSNFLPLSSFNGWLESNPKNFMYKYSRKDGSLFQLTQKY